MSDCKYTGVERRTTLDDSMYNTVCKERFTLINNDIQLLKSEEIIPMRYDVTEIKKRVFNGLSDLPKKMNWVIGILMSFLIALVTFGYTIGQKQGQIEASLQQYVYMTPEEYDRQTEKIVKQVLSEIEK